MPKYSRIRHAAAISLITLVVLVSFFIAAPGLLYIFRSGTVDIKSRAQVYAPDWAPCSQDDECESGICGKDPLDNTFTCLPLPTASPRPEFITCPDTCTGGCDSANPFYQKPLEGTYEYECNPYCKDTCGPNGCISEDAEGGICSILSGSCVPDGEVCDQNGTSCCGDNVCRRCNPEEQELYGSDRCSYIYPTCNPPPICPDSCPAEAGCIVGSSTCVPYCDPDLDCPTGCQPTAMGGSCIRPLVNGQTCEEDIQCASGECGLDNTCVSNSGQFCSGSDFNNNPITIPVGQRITGAPPLYHCYYCLPGEIFYESLVACPDACNQDDNLVNDVIPCCMQENNQNVTYTRDNGLTYCGRQITSCEGATYNNPSYRAAIDEQVTGADFNCHQCQPNGQFSLIYGGHCENTCIGNGQVAFSQIPCCPGLSPTTDSTTGLGVCGPQLVEAVCPADCPACELGTDTCLPYCSSHMQNVCGAGCIADRNGGSCAIVFEPSPSPVIPPPPIVVGLDRPIPLPNGEVITFRNLIVILRQFFRRFFSR